MLTSAFVSFVSYLDVCLDAVGVRPPLDVGAPTSHNPMGPSRPVTWIALPLPFTLQECHGRFT
jgi:hypothetical protein